MTTTQLAKSTRQFFSWWGTQLWECLPAGFRAKSQQRKRPAMVQPLANRFWPAGSDLDASQALDRSAVNAQGGQDLALVLGEENGFRRDVELPAAVEEKFAQVLAFELDRLTPLKAADLFYDFRLKRRNPVRSSITVELAAAPKARVTPLLEACAARNQQVTRLLLTPADADTTFNLLASQLSPEEKESGNRSLWVNVILFALCCALIGGLVITPLWKQRQHVIALQPIEGEAKSEAQISSDLQQQLDRQVSEYNLPLNRKHRYPLSVQVLDDLTKRLPDDTWAQTMEIKAVQGQNSKEVIVQGETGSGGKILQLIQESPLLKEPAFKGALTRVSPEAERYHIVGELIAAEMPQQLQLADGVQEMVLPASTLGSATTTTTPATPAGAPSASSTDAPVENGKKAVPPVPGSGPVEGSKP